MEFKRYDGFVNHIPQEFIDYHLPVCPFCRSTNPHWLLAQKADLTLAGGRNFYRCDCCGGTLSSTILDAAAEKGKSFAINPTAAALHAIHKGRSQQGVTVPYLRVEELGSVCQQTQWLGKEEPITYFQELVKQEAQPAPEAIPAPEAAPVEEPMVLPVPEPEAVPVEEPVVVAPPVVVTAAPTKICGYCGTEIPEDCAFCSACGKSTATPKPQEEAPAFCRHCGAPVSPESVFCGACGGSLSAPAPVPTHSDMAVPTQGTPFAILGGVFTLVFAMFYVILSIVRNLTNAKMYGYEAPIDFATVNRYMIVTAVAVLVAIRLFSRKNDLLLAAGLALLSTYCGISCGPVFFHALTGLFVLAFAVFSSYSGLQDKLKWFARLWFIPLALCGTGFTIMLVSMFSRSNYQVPLNLFGFIAEYLPLIMITLWLKSNLTPSAAAGSYRPGDALARLGGLLLLTCAYCMLPVLSRHMNIEWTIVQLFYASGFGMLGVLMLLRKKNVCLIIAPAILMTANLLAVAFYKGSVFTLFYLSAWSALIALGVFHGIPALQNKTAVVNRLWFIPVAILATVFTYDIVTQTSIQADALFEMAALAVYPLWCKVTDKQ